MVQTLRVCSKERKEHDAAEERLAAAKREAAARADAELSQLRREQLERVERLRRETADEEAQVERARDEVARSMRSLEGEQFELSRKACTVCTRASGYTPTSTSDVTYVRKIGLALPYAEVLPSCFSLILSVLCICTVYRTLLLIFNYVFFLL